MKLAFLASRKRSTRLGRICRFKEFRQLGAPAGPEMRLQYDLDLYCPDNAIEARSALTQIGYESIPSDATRLIISPPRPEDGWQEGRFSIRRFPFPELHFRLWDETTGGFAVPGVEDFWSRRHTDADGRPSALDPSIPCYTVFTAPPPLQATWGRQCTNLPFPGHKRQSTILGGAICRRRLVFIGEFVVQMPDRRRQAGGPAHPQVQKWFDRVVARRTLFRPNKENPAAPYLLDLSEETEVLLRVRPQVAGAARLRAFRRTVDLGVAPVEALPVRPLWPGGQSFTRARCCPLFRDAENSR
jgi:hypothetical protein